MRWTDGQREVLRLLYGKLSTREVARLLECSQDTVRTQASRLGLTCPRVRPLEGYYVGDEFYVPLSGKKHPGLVARVSADKAELVKDHVWHAAKHGKMLYVRSRINGVIVYMHRLVMGFPWHDIDHKDFDGLNNTDDNLRLATHAENIAHQRRSDTLRGIGRQGRRWFARIGQTRLGWYDTPEEAAKAYDKAALEKWGEFATLNYPLEI